MQLVNCRDLNKQLGDAQHLQQLKLDAQAVIMDSREQEDTQRALKRKLIRAKADLEVLLLDDKQAYTLLLVVGLYIEGCACSMPAPQFSTFLILTCV